MRASRRPQQAWVWHAELSKQQPRNAGASVNLQHMYEPVRTSVVLGLQSYVPGRHDWNVSARVVSDAALLQASFDQQPARRLLERKLQPLRAGDLFVWLGQAALALTLTLTVTPTPTPSLSLTLSLTLTLTVSRTRPRRWPCPSACSVRAACTPSTTRHGVPRG